MTSIFSNDLHFFFFCRIIGVLPSLERDECKKIIESYGGRVTTAVSGKTDYLLAGRDVGKTKTEKAEKLRIKIISEDDLLEMIRRRPENKNVDAKSTTSTKSAILKPIDNNSFVSVSSSKLKVYKQDDGILCKFIQKKARGKKRIHQNPSGSIRIHQDPPGSTRIHQDPSESTRIHQDPQGPSGSIRIHQDPQDPSGSKDPGSAFSPLKKRDFCLFVFFEIFV